jgi:hypothetical protein
MKTYRMNAVMAGALYILGTVAGVSSAIAAGDLVIGEDVLSRIAADPSRPTLVAFFILIMGFSLTAMTVFLYPLFRKDSEPLAMGMVLFRGALEGSGYVIGALIWLLLGALSKEITAGGAGSAALQSLGDVVLQLGDKRANIGAFAFTIGATCLYISFYRTRLIPRWLSIWGLIAAASVIVDLMQFFGSDAGLEILYMPLAVQEMVMALWLIVKGFNLDAIAKLDEAH